MNKIEVLCKMMNQLLYDLTLAQRNIHIVHWNLKAETFIFLHEYLGEVYEEVTEYIDETAEQIRYKGEYPNAKISVCLERSMLQEIESNEPLTHTQAVETAIATIKYLKALTDDIVTYADSHEIWDSVDTFTKHTVYYSKVLYFLENSLVNQTYYKR